MFRLKKEFLLNPLIAAQFDDHQKALKKTTQDPTTIKQNVSNQKALMTLVKGKLNSVKAEILRAELVATPAIVDAGVPKLLVHQLN